MRAVRFALPPGGEDDGYQGICGTNSVTQDGQTGNVEAVSRNGSRQHLSEDGAGRDTAEGQKPRSSFLCGLCCSKAPEVSVWNCDGEILNVTEITCRYKSAIVSIFFLLQCFNSSNFSPQGSRPAGSPVRPRHRGCQPLRRPKLRNKHRLTTVTRKK